MTPSTLVAVIAAGVGAVNAAYLVPDLLIHRAGLWTLTRGRQGVPGTGDKRCALTFDDGPDDRFTPLILNVLRNHGSRATFFVLGEKVLKFPDLTERIVAEGHEIGVHGWNHRHPWLLSPWTCRAHLEKAASLIGRASEGHYPTKYRPPWGFWSLWTVIGSSGFERVMWSLPGGDWRETTTPESLSDEVIGKAQAGSVVLLHDGADYSWKTASALHSILRGLEEKGLRTGTVSDLAEVTMGR